MEWPAPNEVRSLAAAARVLGCTEVDLRELASENDQRRFYKQLRIPKKSKKRRGQYRTVYQANQRLALIQKNLASWLGGHIKFLPYVQGFVHGRSIVSNARIHLGQKTLLHVDIKDFFDSIQIGQVLEALRTLGCEPDVADVLARISTLNRRLPQGSSASPILANIVCRHLDTDFSTLAAASNCLYSRYADDITFSGDRVPDAADVAALVAKHGFALRDKTCRIQRRGRAQYVTGLSIADVKSPRIHRVMKRRLRLELHYAVRYGIEDHLRHLVSDETPEHAVARLGGWMSFIYSVEGIARRTLYERWLRVNEQVFGSKPEDDSYEDAPER